MRIVRSFGMAETSSNRGASSALVSALKLYRALTSSRSWLQARLEQRGKGWSHIDENHRPQCNHEERQRKSARGHQSVESKNVDENGRQHGYRQRYVTVDQQKNTCNELKPEDYPQVMRSIQDT